MHASIQFRVRRHRVGAYFASALLLGLSACAPTQLVTRWRDPSFQGPPLHKVLVVDLQSDQGRRRLWEDSMAASLLRLGVAATPSYQAFNDPAPNPDRLAASGARQGFNAVIATHFVAAGTRQYWMPGNAGLGFGSRWRYFDYWDATRGSGFVQPQQQVDYQSEVFTVGPNGGKLIWTGTTRSLDSGSTESATDQIGRTLVPALQQAGILVRQKT